MRWLEPNWLWRSLFPLREILAAVDSWSIEKQNGEVGSLDYREKAPLAATKDMFLDKDGNVIKGKSTETALAIGIPGTVARVFAVHKKYGSMRMSEILKPVIALAERGVAVTAVVFKFYKDLYLKLYEFEC